MKISKNEGSLDRLIRFAVAEVSFLLAFFWVGGIWAWIFYVVSVVTIFTALTGFCGLYTLLHINTTGSSVFSKKQSIFAVVIMLAMALVGGYYSDFFTKKFFLEDYNSMNNYYKQTLFYTGQNKRDEAIDNYRKLAQAYPIFLDKYTHYHPLVIKFDGRFNADILNVSQMINSLGDQIQNGDLIDAHKKMELIRPIFQDILKRNGFSMLAVALVDFHDSMEVVISAADSKDASALIAASIDADAKLRAVEEISNDTEIQAIRTKLSELIELANNNKTDALSAKAAELKSAFVKVYLKRG